MRKNATGVDHCKTRKKGNREEELWGIKETPFTWARQLRAVSFWAELRRKSRRNWWGVHMIAPTLEILRFSLPKNARWNSVCGSELPEGGELFNWTKRFSALLTGSGSLERQGLPGLCSFKCKAHLPCGKRPPRCYHSQPGLFTQCASPSSASPKKPCTKIQGISFWRETKLTEDSWLPREKTLKAQASGATHTLTAFMTSSECRIVWCL